MADEVTTGEVADGGLVGEGLWIVVIGEFGGRGEVAFGAEEVWGDGGGGGEERWGGGGWPHLGPGRLRMGRRTCGAGVRSCGCRRALGQRRKGRRTCSA